MKESIMRKLKEGICERGNSAFNNGDSSILFSRIGDDTWLQASYSPNNYPAWGISVINATPEEMADHVGNRLDGWDVDKCNDFDINMDACKRVIGHDDVADDIMVDVLDRSKEYGFTLDTLETIDRCVDESAQVLGYNLTKFLRLKCYQKIVDELENLID